MGGILSCCLGGAASGGAARADVYKLDERGRATAEVSCPTQWIGRVIGSGGSTLQTLRTSTGASVEVHGSQTGKGRHSRVVIAGTPAQVTACRSAVEAIIEQAERPDYEGKRGKKWRAEADRCAREAERAAKEKDRLFNAGDKAGGRGDPAGRHAKLKEVKEWQRKMHAANAEAAEEIFLHRNAGKNYHGDMHMDFHGLRKAEAIAVLESRLEKLMKKKKKGELELITGAGHHSGGAGPVLKPAIVKVLREKRMTFEEKNVGSIVVRL